MKNLQNFEAFKMNKVQMNAIAGGKICYLSITQDDGTQIYIDAEVPSSMSNDEAYDALHNKYDSIWGGGNVIVTKCSS